MIYYFEIVLICLPKIPETPAAIPPITPATIRSKVEFPLSIKSVAIFLARTKSLALVSK